MMRKKLSLFITIILFTVIITPYLLSAKEPATEPEIRKLTKEDIFGDLELFADALVLIDANYVKDVKSKDMIYGALNGMLSSLDSHSSFLTPEDFKELRTETKGEFGGLGIKITLRNGILTVVSPLEGTPAFEAGILPGDKILKIDDETTEDFDLDDAVKRLRGIPGTEVRLTIIREDEDALREFKLKRAIIKIDSIKEASILKDKLGYIRIVDFQQDTGSELEKALRLLSKKKMKGLILDLRNNPGGLLSASVLVSEKFLKRGDPIVSTKGKIKEQDGDFKSRAVRPYSDFPIAILQNRGSASASEIVAGALRDNKRALVVGEKSFGKGSVQTVVPMRDGSALRLTTSYYYTPSGSIIHKKGITPDIEVKLVRSETTGENAKKKKLSTKERLLKDEQVKAALELLKDEERYASLINGEEEPQ
ncbi:MAG: S41 family peptidase [Candidatus Omnitrophica bacterium]|nr:S41 family peptidase [Candidatus Omnitrophota bacterium]